MAVVDRPTTTADASGWTESPDQGDQSAPPEAPVTSPQAGTNGLDATGQALQPEEATEANEPPRRSDGRFEKNGFRRRAASQQASAADVPRIQELTRRLRETERERDTYKAGGVPPAASNGHPPAPDPVAPPAPVRESPAPPRGFPPPPPPFTAKEPTFEDFAGSEDPLRDYTKAMARFTNAEQQHEYALRYYENQKQKAAGQYETELKDMTQAHWQRMASVTADPRNADLVTRFKDDNRPITPAILQAIVRSGDQSAHLTIGLLRQPGLLEELTLATYDKPVTPDLVALVQRRLQSLGLSAATTGLATAPVPRPAPRPPNPVRTAPEAPPRELPGDDASLADHAAAFHQPRRSRLRRDR